MAAASPRLALIQERFLPGYFETGRLVSALDRALEIDQGLYLLRPEAGQRVKAEAILLRDWLLAECRASNARDR